MINIAKSRVSFPRLGIKEMEKQKMIQTRKFMRIIEANTKIELDEEVAGTKEESNEAN